MRRKALLATGLVLLATSLLLPVTPAPAGAAGSGSPSYVAAAEYFGSGNPFNMWSSDLSGAPKAFARMRSDGFNTVGLVLPWGEFQPKLTPPRYDRLAFSRLDQVIRAAAALHMGVILRLSYEFDVDPYDQLAGATRFDEIWSNRKVYTAWLDYVAAVHKSVAGFHNVREAYISWEDLWQPVFQSQGATTPTQQMALATSTGYRAWLQQHYSLTQVSATYGTQFASWTDVPTPPPHSPSFKLMYQYQDTALVHRLFLPAAKRFPGLTMETRVDVDSIYTGTQVVGSYTHDVLYQLPGTKVTGMYFSPYMGDPSSTHVETAAQALSALQTTLSRMSSASGGRTLMIYEYEFVSNSTAVATDPALTPVQIPTFLSQSEPLLQQYTGGYALWTYQDYTLSPVYNPSFAVGRTGWKLSGAARPKPSRRSTSYLAMGAGGKAAQPIQPLFVNSTTPATVAFRARAPHPTTLDVTWGSGGTQTVHVTGGGWHRYQVTVPPSTGTLTVSSKGAVSVTQIQLYWFTQLGDVYSTTGVAEVGAAPLRSLNKQLTSGH